MPKKPDAPRNMAERTGQMKEELKRRMREKREAAKAALGDIPYGTEKVTDEERLLRYGQLRNDPEQFMAVLQKIMMKDEDGQIMLPKEFLADIRDMEAHLRKGVGIR